MYKTMSCKQYDVVARIAEPQNCRLHSDTDWDSFRSPANAGGQV